MNVVKIDTPKQSDNEIQLEMYRSMINGFFARNYPTLNPDLFWDWFLSSLTEKDLSIESLSPNDISLFLNELNKVGNMLFQPVVSENSNS